MSNENINSLHRWTNSNFSIIKSTKDTETGLTFRSFCDSFTYSIFNPHYNLHMNMSFSSRHAIRIMRMAMKFYNYALTSLCVYPFAKILAFGDRLPFNKTLANGDRLPYVFPIYQDLSYQQPLLRSKKQSQQIWKTLSRLEPRLFVCLIYIHCKPLRSCRDITLFLCKPPRDTFKVFSAHSYISN